jgi:hypothetical protein
VKNEDRIKDVETTELSMGLFTNDETPYLEDLPIRDGQLLTFNSILEKRNEKLELKNGRYRDNTELRRALVVAFTTIIAFWLLSVLLILTGNNCKHYDLSENTLIAFMTTSTANVLGMMYVILKNLFPEKKVKGKSADKK